MMEWVLQDQPDTDPYIDDSITGSDGTTEEELLKNNFEAVRALLKRYAEQRIVCHPDKSHFFQKGSGILRSYPAGGSEEPCPWQIIANSDVGAPPDRDRIVRFSGFDKLFFGICRTLCRMCSAFDGEIAIESQRWPKRLKNAFGVDRS